MKKFLFLSFLILPSLFCLSQDIPKIGDTKGVKEKFLLIKKGLADLKKNLTKPDPMWTSEREVIFEMGDGIVLFEEDEEEETESLTIQYSSDPYFSGSLDEFKTFYEKLISIISEVFSKTHEPSHPGWLSNDYVTVFMEKGKDIESTHNSININFSSLTTPYVISITITRYKNPKK